MRIGVIGYSGQKFDEDKALELINHAFGKVVSDLDVTIVSGLTNLGIPKLSYEAAVNLGWSTAGIACNKAKNYEQFDCDEIILEGENWGDESGVFLKNIDMLLRFGGGEQSIKEYEKAKFLGIPCAYYELDTIND